LNAGTTHWTNRLIALRRLIPLRLNCVIAVDSKLLAFNAFTWSTIGSTLSQTNVIVPAVLIQRMTEFC
jgi:hypothetical protein